MSKEKEITDTTEEPTPIAYWQWIKGDDSGLVVTIKDEDSNWINFNEGGRLSKDLKNEFLQQLDPNIAGEFINTPKANNPLHTSIAKNNTSSVNIPNEIVNKTKSPIRILFDKQKKNNKVKLLLEFPINIPPKAIYELMSTSFDNTEVNEELYSFILNQLSKDEIEDCLHDSIKSLIESKYKD